MELRPYQHAAVNAVYRYLRERDGNPVVVVPTGGGKSAVAAQIASDAVLQWGGRVLILAHVRELLEQNADKLRRLAPQLRVGVYSAGLKRRDTDTPVVVAGIQSVYQKAYELGPFDLAIVDEAHLIGSEGEGMYRQLLADAKVVNPHIRLIGLTATPFRLKSGLIYGPDQLLTDVCFEIGLRELIHAGYLCPLISKAGIHNADLSRVTVRAGEFVAEEAEAAMDQDELVRSACREIVAATRDRQACLIFASGLAHARHICQVLQEDHSVECGFVCGETPSAERDELLARFQGWPPDGLFPKVPLKYLCNVGVLTTGFDCPRLDAIAVLRPTMSPGLLVQILGRGTRLHPGKQNCLVLDFGGNILRHGPVDQIRVPTGASAKRIGEAAAKECPQCHALIATGYATCPECGHAFPPPERPKHDPQAARVGVLSGQATDTEFEVQDITYTVHTKKGAGPDAPRTMRVMYRLGLTYSVSEFICFEHTGYARRKAEAWWRARSNEPVPESAEAAVEIANNVGIATSEVVTVRHVAGDDFERLIAHRLGERLARVGSAEIDDLPF